MHNVVSRLDCTRIGDLFKPSGQARMETKLHHRVDRCEILQTRAGMYVSDDSRLGEADSLRVTRLSAVCHAHPTSRSLLPKVG